MHVSPYSYWKPFVVAFVLRGMINRHSGEVWANAFIVVLWVGIVAIAVLDAAHAAKDKP